MNDLSIWCANEYDRDHSTNTDAARITITCHWCGEIQPFTNTVFGRQMLNAWPENHDCKDHRSNWSA